jgi:hypothetical protein
MTRITASKRRNCIKIIAKDNFIGVLEEATKIFGGIKATSHFI